MKITQVRAENPEDLSPALQAKLKTLQYEKKQAEEDILQIRDEISSITATKKIMDEEEASKGHNLPTGKENHVTSSQKQTDDEYFASLGIEYQDTDENAVERELDYVEL